MTTNVVNKEHGGFLQLLFTVKVHSLSVMSNLELGRKMDLESLGLHVSNRENKQLEDEIREKRKEINVHQVKLDQHEERIHAITNHLKNVKQELQHTQVSYTILLFQLNNLTVEIPNTCIFKLKIVADHVELLSNIM